MYSGALISGAFSGLISAGVKYGMDGARGYSAWQWLFIIEGAATIAIAFACYWILPNFPRTTSWLTDEERELAIWRLEEDIGEDDWTTSADQTFWQGAKLAFTDGKTYVLVSSSPSRSFACPVDLTQSPPDAPSLHHRRIRHRNQLLPRRRQNPQLRRR